MRPLHNFPSNFPQSHFLLFSFSIPFSFSSAIPFSLYNIASATPSTPVARLYASAAGRAAGLAAGRRRGLVFCSARPFR
jgi:hypothetical protein